MKRVLNIEALILMAIILLLNTEGFSQNWGGSEKNKFGDLWSVNLNAGLTSFYGDLSMYDTDPYEKLTQESDMAFGLQVTKYIGQSFGLTGQLLFGKLKGQKNEMSFKTKLFEYSLQGSVDFVNLFSRTKNHKFHVMAFAGVGHFLFDARMWEHEGDARIEEQQTSDVPELVGYVGGGFAYQVAKNLAVTSEIALRRSQNDRIDNYKKGDDYDYYSYISVGITYYISTFIKRPPKNKASIVFKDTRFKPLK